VSQSDAEATIIQNLPENRLAALATSPLASPIEAELLKELSAAHRALKELRRELEQVRAEFESLRADVTKPTGNVTKPQTDLALAEPAPAPAAAIHGSLAKQRATWPPGSRQ
jgi:hypothetical protein